MKDRFGMDAYTGAVIDSFFWRKLVIDILGMRHRGKFPALREHARDRVVGVIDQVKKSSRLSAQGYFTEATPDGREIKALLTEGYPYQASVGLEIETVEEVGEGAQAVVNGSVFRGPGFIARKSYLREISFVALGADDQTSAYKLAAAAPGSQGGNMDNPIKKFDDQVNALVDSNKCTSRGGAVVFIASRAPELRENYVEATNEAFDDAAFKWTFITGEPADFSEAVNKMLGAGHDPREAVRLAAARYPELYAARQRRLAELLK